MFLAVQTIHGLPREKKWKRKKAGEDAQGPEEHSLVMSKRNITNGDKMKTLFGGPQQRQKNACQKATIVSIRVIFALTNPTKEQARIIPRKKTKNEKAGKERFLNPDSQPQKHTMKKDMARPENQTIGLPVVDSWTPDAGWF